MTAPYRLARRLARNPALARTVAAYGLFSVAEYAVWIAVLVYAYGHGGATAAGLVALAELMPAALAAPLVAALASRQPPATLLVVGYGVQAMGCALLTGGIASGGPPWPAYAGAVIASTAVAIVRPAQASLLPALSHDAEDLLAGNVAVSWLESVCIAIAGAGSGAVLAAGRIDGVTGGCVVMLLGAGLLVAGVPATPLGLVEGDDADPSPALRQGAQVLRRSPAAGVLVAMLGAEFLVVGALDVAFVVLAVDLLHRGDGWVGYLNTAYGVGGVLVGAAAAAVLGRRLGPVLVACALALGGALAAAATVHAVAAVAVLLAVVGAGRALFDVSARALLQRAVPTDVVGAVFGWAEGVAMTGLAVGSVLVPVFVATVGRRGAVLATAALLPIAALVASRALWRVDAAARVPVVEISLLRQVSLLQRLPVPAVEGAARALRRRDVATGETVMREGEPGDEWYAVAAGTLEVHRHGAFVRSVGRGGGVGEIALLERVPRTATVVATEPSVLYALGREEFLTAVTGNAATRRSAVAMTAALRASDAAADAALATAPAVPDSGMA